MKISVKWKDGEQFDLQAYEIKVTEGHITLTEEKHRFWTTLKLSEIQEYKIDERRN